MDVYVAEGGLVLPQQLLQPSGTVSWGLGVHELGSSASLSIALVVGDAGAGSDSVTPALIMLGVGLQLTLRPG